MKSQFVTSSSSKISGINLHFLLGKEDKVCLSWWQKDKGKDWHREEYEMPYIVAAILLERDL